MDIRIYVLRHPLTKEIRYVGKTKNPIKYRRRDHIGAARKGCTGMPVYNWIRKLLEEGLEPDIEEVALVNEDNWRKEEDSWIMNLRLVGCSLLNACGGGLGISSHSEETKQKIREALNGKKQSEESKRKKSEKLKGRIFSKETRKKISDGKRNYKFSDEHRRNIWLTSKGRKPTQENLVKMQQRMRELWGDPNCMLLETTVMQNWGKSSELIEQRLAK